MKIFKKQIPVRHILYVVLGWSWKSEEKDVL